MSIDIPGELAWLDWVAGSAWPEGDEDDMWGIGDDWRSAAAELRTLLPELRAAEQATIDAYPWGDGLDAMISALDRLDHGPESLEHLADLLDSVAESADGLGTEIQYTKILVLSSLAMLAAEIAAAWLFPPTAPLSESVAIATTRVAVRLLGERAVTAIARFAAKTGLAALAKFAAKHVVFGTMLGTGQDLAIQTYQVGAGHRRDIDWTRVATTAYTAAAAGAIGGPAGSAFGKAANHIHLPGGSFGNALNGATVGATSGMLGGLGAWAVGGLANGWTWDPRLLTSASAYGVLVGGTKGFRHPTTPTPPEAHRFTAPESPSAPTHSSDGSTPRPQTRAGDPNALGPDEPAPSASSSPTLVVAGGHRPAAEVRPRPAAEPGPEPATQPLAAKEVKHDPAEPKTKHEGAQQVEERLDAAREKLRRLGVNPDGMTPIQLRQAAEEAFGRKGDEFAERTAALEGAGLRPGELRVQRMELQKQIDEFLALRRDLRADLPQAEEPEKPQPNTSPPATETPESAAETSAPPAGAAENGQPPNGSRQEEEVPDTTSKIPYTPRYFNSPPIPRFEPATPPPDTVWQPDPSPTGTPAPGPTGQRPPRDDWGW
ncbi:hypothetical protein D7D52_16535 [Nocardia yunnanensis]|uniref:Outer membrane channel protein CpnT-like N-terminal domain-containing protein n=1 Tax=Nocardia yunnanensis TaxID=2382165 RepID=A0A386ZF12_9NOCA|nr:hypothetical protein [Nocardia yunnanensis]AYF75205.1 hypothetical protein D7D52_16535 [Nocardia yunnanensis]